MLPSSYMGVMRTRMKLIHTYWILAGLMTTQWTTLHSNSTLSTLLSTSCEQVGSHARKYSRLWTPTYSNKCIIVCLLIPTTMSLCGTHYCFHEQTSSINFMIRGRSLFFSLVSCMCLSPHLQAGWPGNFDEVYELMHIFKLVFFRADSMGDPT